MDQFINTLKDLPTAVTSLSTAFISAAVALIVVVLSQWALSRRNRKDFLTNKLEELYLLVNEIGEHNVERFELLVKLSNGKRKFDDTNSEETVRIYGLDINKKIVMLIRLYFPKLALTHQKTFQANRNINQLIFNLNNGDKTDSAEIDNVLSEFINLLKQFEDEIIQNKDILIKSSILPQIYKKTV
jgi:hypothetical protein